MRRSNIVVKQCRLKSRMNKKSYLKIISSLCHNGFYSRISQSVHRFVVVPFVSLSIESSSSLSYWWHKSSLFSLVLLLLLQWLDIRDCCHHNSNMKNSAHFHMMFAMLLLTLGHAVFVSMYCCVIIVHFCFSPSSCINIPVNIYHNFHPHAETSIVCIDVVWAVYIVYCCLIVIFRFPPDAIQCIREFILLFFRFYASTFVYWIETFSFNTTWNAYSNFFCWFYCKWTTLHG